jgi:CBS domain-containing protein
VANTALLPILQFLRQHAPFAQMAEADLLFLAEAAKLRFYPANSLIHDEGTVVEQLLIIKEGAVRGEKDGKIAWELTVGESFPLGALLSLRPIRTKHYAVVDSFCLEVSRAVFERLLQRSAVFQDFCTRRLAHLLEQSSPTAPLATHSESLEMPLSTLIRRPPVTCLPDTPLRQVFQQMVEAQVSSMIVVNAAGELLGLLTLPDVLPQVVLPEKSLATPISAVMRRPVYSLPPEQPAYAALLAMLAGGFHHLPIVKEQKVIGMVTERDLFALQRIGLIRLTRALQQADSLATCTRLSQDIAPWVQQMLAQGVKIKHLLPMLGQLYDHLTRRVLELVAADFQQEQPDFAEIPWLWLSFGSEGRGEQTLLTDQDNGLVFPDAYLAAKPLLLAFAERANAALAQVGFRLCPGNIMASNPGCCLSLSEWKTRFYRWIDQGSPQHLLEAAIFFDARPLFSAATAATVAADWQSFFVTAYQKAAATPRFLQALAQNALAFSIPIGFFQEWRTSTLDAKMQALAPLTAALRIFALASGESQVAGGERLQGLAKVLPEGEVKNIAQAYYFVQQLRFEQQVADWQQQNALSNHISLKKLSELQQRLLKECLRQINKLQSRLRLDYQL